ncbi:hypothetical protein E2C01_006773 [Portunus trituberculatus]|uniref:Uncharacterized protein n=1 Tax=Portunus trituberculatus TaxID=210409 RepID=A0A5B7CX76_PORTR|nr:hypothetical protein [Portunus trituberculatus]
MTEAVDLHYLLVYSSQSPLLADLTCPCIPPGPVLSASQRPSPVLFPSFTRHMSKSPESPHPPALALRRPRSGDNGTRPTTMLA